MLIFASGQIFRRVFSGSTKTVPVIVAAMVRSGIGT